MEILTNIGTTFGRKERVSISRVYKSLINESQTRPPAFGRCAGHYCRRPFVDTQVGCNAIFWPIVDDYRFVGDDPYPDIVHASLTINSPNSAKPIVTKVQGKLVKLLVKENENVKVGQSLAYIESTANHVEVVDLLNNLKVLQKGLSLDNSAIVKYFDNTVNSRLGELQASYQTFYQEYLSYKSSVENGFYIKQKSYLEKDLSDLRKQEIQLQIQTTIQKRDFDLAEQQFRIYQRLFQQKVATSSELRTEESKYLAKKNQLAQTNSGLITANTNSTGKQKEILGLENQITEEKSKFIQALYSLISQIEDWKSKYILTASQNGKLSFATMIQENEVLSSNQDVFLHQSGK